MMIFGNELDNSFSLVRDNSLLAPLDAFYEGRVEMLSHRPVPGAARSVEMAGLMAIGAALDLDGAGGTQMEDLFRPTEDEEMAFEKMPWDDVLASWNAFLTRITHYLHQMSGHRPDTVKLLEFKPR